MAKKGILTELNEELVSFFEGEKLVMLSTIDHESQAPNVSAISWVKCLDKNNIRFSVTTNSRTIQNVKENPHV
ncbi:pyridoxamine 5'-phosphate oxidase family protein, partial [Micrococcus sp. SIMBA_131]